MRRLCVFSTFVFAVLVLQHRAYCDEQERAHFSRIQIDYPEWAKGLALEDFNGDGFLDALISYKKFWSVLLGDGKGGFSELNRYTHDVRGPLQVGDVDGDTIVDVLVNGELWRNDGAGNFSKRPIAIEGDQHPHFLDLDSDGDLDAISFGKLAVHWNEGNGRFNSRPLQFDSSTLRTAVKYGDVTSADIDRDGLIDLVVRGQYSSWIVFNENGRFGKAKILQFGDTKNAPVPDGGILLGDFDGDNDIDTVLFRYGLDEYEPEISIWTQDSKWKFRKSPIVRGSEGWFSGGTKADFDQDGDVDLFIGKCGRVNKIWLNDGKGKFESSIELGSATHLVAIGDIDNDGDIDILTARGAPPTVWINRIATSDSR